MEAAARESRIRGIIAVGGRERLCKGNIVSAPWRMEMLLMDEIDKLTDEVTKV